MLRNATLDAWEENGRPVAPDRPGEGEVVARDPGGWNLPRYAALMPWRGLEGDVGEMALYAGQSAGLVNDVRPAAEIVAQLVREAEAALDVGGVGRDVGR